MWRAKCPSRRVFRTPSAGQSSLPNGIVTRRRGPLTKRVDASLGGFPDPFPCCATGRTRGAVEEAGSGGDNSFAFVPFLPSAASFALAASK